MEVINEQNKQRLIDYIELNDLDYVPVDNGLTRFHILSEDKVTFTIYNSGDQFLVSSMMVRKILVNQVNNHLNTINLRHFQRF